MLSTARIKTLLEDTEISEKKAEEIRDAFRLLAEIIFEKWQTEKEQGPERALPHKVGVGYNRDVDPP